MVPCPSIYWYFTAHIYNFITFLLPKPLVPDFTVGRHTFVYLACAIAFVYGLRPLWFVSFQLDPEYHNILCERHLLSRKQPPRCHISIIFWQTPTLLLTKAFWPAKWVGVCVFSVSPLWWIPVECGHSFFKTECSAFSSKAVLCLN